MRCFFFDSIKSLFCLLTAARVKSGNRSDRSKKIGVKMYFRWVTWLSAASCLLSLSNEDKHYLWFVRLSVKEKLDMRGNQFRKYWCRVLHVRLEIVAFLLYQAVRVIARFISALQTVMELLLFLRQRQRKGLLAIEHQTAMVRAVTLPTLIWPQALAMDRFGQRWYREKR